jgi:MYXO-CTERM domain-containing protein
MSSTGTGGYIGEIEFDAAPEPASTTLAGLGLLGLCLGLRRGRRRAR